VCVVVVAAAAVVAAFVVVAVVVFNPFICGCCHGFYVVY